MPDLRSGIVHGFFVVEEEPHGFLLLDGYFFWGIRTNLPSFLASWLLAGRAPPRILHSGCRTDPGGPLRRVRLVASISFVLLPTHFYFGRYQLLVALPAASERLPAHSTNLYLPKLRDIGEPSP